MLFQAATAGAIATAANISPASAALPEQALPTVNIISGHYVPDYVAVHVDDFVRFLNEGHSTHQVSFKTPYGHECNPSPLILAPGRSGTCKFTSPGTYAFYDPKAGVTFHGSIVVTSGDVAPAITSISTATFVTGKQASFAIMASGVPAPTLTISGALPSGLGFDATSAGHATISGTAVGPSGTFVVTLVASNGVGADAKQTFTLTVVQPPAPGYVVADSSGFAYFYGQAIAGAPLSVNPAVRPIVAVTRSPGDVGYYLVTARGGVYNLGGAPFYGSVVNEHLSATISGFATTPDGKGYWLVSTTGSVFPFGDAHSYSSLAVSAQTGPVVGIGATASGDGYWIATATGHVYNFGDAAVYGSAPTRLPHPIVALTVSSDGKGYYLVSSGGNVYNLGDAAFYGSTATAPPAHPIAGLVPTLDGKGYYLVTSSGNVYNFGDAVFYGSPAHSRHSGTVVGIAIPD